MTRETEDVEPKTIGEIYNLIQPLLNPNKQREFFGITRSWGTQRRQLFNVMQETSNLTISAVDDFEYGQSLISDIKLRRSQTEDFIYRPKSYFLKGIFRAQLGRIYTALGIIQEHPWLAPLTREEEIAEVFQAEANHRLLAVQETVKTNLQPQISEAQKSLTLTRNRLLNFSERVTINSLETSKKYTQILPVRARSLAEKYGQRFGLVSDRITGMDQLLEYILPYIEGRKQKDKTYRQLTEEGILSNITDLPEPIKRRLQVWSSYQFLMLLSQDGLTLKPELPDIFQNFN